MTDPTASAGAPALPTVPVMPQAGLARVIDIYRGDVLVSDVHKTDPIADFSALDTAGVWGLIQRDRHRRHHQWSRHREKRTQ